MNKPQAKAIFFFLGMVGVGYVIGIQVMTALGLGMSTGGFINLTILAIIFAVLMTIFFDKPFELELIKWSEKQPEEEIEAQLSDEGQPPASTPHPKQEGDVAALEAPKIVKGALFPHEIPTPHWDVDFSNNKQTYEGSALPIWILAGWAVFILWAIVYLVIGLPTAF